RSGRARVRVEAPIGACLLVRAGGQVIRFPILSLLEGPQHTVPQAPVDVGVERLAWDALEVRLGDGDGTVAPGATAPVTIGFNVPPAASVRRVSLAVVEPKPQATPPSGQADGVVDTIDLARLWGSRPSASGRASLVAAGKAAWDVPAAALAEARRRDRLRGWI